MKLIIYLILTFLLLNSVANAQEYSTAYTRVVSNDKQELIEETTLFSYTDSTLEIMSPTIMQKFIVIGQMTSASYLLVDNYDQLAIVEYSFYRKRKFLHKTKTYKFITLIYTSKFTFFFDNPNKLF